MSITLTGLQIAMLSQLVRASDETADTIASALITVAKELMGVEVKMRRLPPALLLRPAEPD